MATSPMNKVVQHLRKTVLLRDEAGLTDGQLLGCFIEQRDEAAFAALLRRHGAMVWGVCRRLLANYHDAEDAFQATFLVLVRKSASIVPRERVANWLHGVAYQTALKARATAARRKARERQVQDMPEPAAVPPDLWRDLQPLLDQELNRLPDTYRLPLILCDLEGKTRKEAACQLGWPEGTVAGRLVRARAMLAKRLARHGPVLSVGAVTAVLAQRTASASAPSSVVLATVKATRLFAAGEPAAGLISARVAALTERVLQAMLLSKFRIVVAVLLLVSVVGIGVSGRSQRTLAGDGATSSSRLALPKLDEGNLKETVLALEQRIWQAHARQDLNTFKSLLADDFVGTDMFGRPYNKAGTLDYVTKFRVIEHSLRDARVILLNASSAIVTYEVHYKVRPTAGGKVESTARRATAAWARRKGRWWYVYFEDRPIQKDGTSWKENLLLESTIKIMEEAGRRPPAPKD
jgi:RNA polymerase sigma factor (sigma-70 family)